MLYLCGGGAWLERRSRSSRWDGNQIAPFRASTMASSWGCVWNRREVTSGTPLLLVVQECSSSQSAPTRSDEWHPPPKSPPPASSPSRLTTQPLVPSHANANPCIAATPLGQFQLSLDTRLAQPDLSRSQSPFTAPSPSLGSHPHRHLIDPA